MSGSKADLSPEGLIAWCESQVNAAKNMLRFPGLEPWQITNCTNEINRCEAIVERLRSGARPQVTPEALKPFADFMVRADRMGLPDETPLTAGSSLAQRQLTAGDFRALLASVAPGPSIREVVERTLQEIGWHAVTGNANADHVAYAVEQSLGVSPAPSIRDVAGMTITIIKTVPEWLESIAKDEWGPEELQVQQEIVAAVERLAARLSRPAPQENG